MKFIISIFLLILCIVVSQTAYYYLQEPTIEGNTTEPPITPPKFIEKYVNKITNKNTYKPGIDATVTEANKVTTIEKKKQMKIYLNSLNDKINKATDLKKSLNAMVYFCVSLPIAFRYFFLPDDIVPIPYNKLHAEIPDIFRSSNYYTNIQKICILWQQSMLLFTPEGYIIQPETPIFNSIISSLDENGYLFELKNISNKLINDYE